MRNAFFILIAMTVSVLSSSLTAEDAVAGTNPATAPQPGVVTDVRAERFLLSGHVVAANGEPIPKAAVQLGTTTARTDAQGSFRLPALAGENKISISASGYTPLAVPVFVSADTDLKFEMQPSSTTTVSAQVDGPISAALTRIYESDELQARPGQPGVPVALPGYPSETASGGVKAPQYFAPGVAGDHGEPIAQYIQIGDFLFPNNLPANAHGNGYADPNLLIPNAISFVESDAGAFDVRHGNNAVDLAVAYGLVPRLEPMAQISTDSHDYDVVSGWSPANPRVGAWLGMEIAGGDGFLALPEYRHQYKVNGERNYSFGHHLLTLFGAGYYGQSRIPGFVPIATQVPQDTIDPRQSDRTHYGFIHSLRYVAGHGSATAPVLGISPHLQLGSQVRFRRWLDSAIRISHGHGRQHFLQSRRPMSRFSRITSSKKMRPLTGRSNTWVRESSIWRMES